MKNGIDLKKFKKTKSDKKSTTLTHSDGHQLIIAHNGLSKKLKSQMDALPHYDEGGLIDPEAMTEMASPAKVSQEELDQITRDQEAARIAESSPNASPLGQSFEQPSSVVSQPSDSVDVSQSSAEVPSDIPSDSSYGPQPITPQEQTVQSGIAPPMSGYDQQEAGIKAEANAQANLGKTQADLLKNSQAELQKLEQGYEEKAKVYQKEIENAVNDLKSGEVKAGHYWDNLTTGGKVATSIGLFLGGIGGALTHQENPALKVLNQNIDRDIEAQKSNFQKKENLVSAYYKQFGNLNDATAMARAVKLGILQNQFQEASLRSQDPMVHARAQQAIGLIEREKQKTMAPLLVRQALESHPNKFPESLDPAKLVPLLIPKDHQKQAFSEIETAENTKKMGASIMNAFEQAAKENTAIRTGAGFRTPPGVYALHQSMQPTFKDLEGTVRQAAMDNTFKNITPRPGDMESTVESKRQNLKDYLKSKESSPTARGYGIDLSKFERTSAYEQPKYKIVNGVKYMRGPNGEAIKVDQ